MEVAVRNTQRAERINTPRVVRIVKAALRHISEHRSRGRQRPYAFDPDEVEVSVSFVGDRRMRELNRNYRGKDKTTDVLSFPQLEGRVMPGGSGNLGDIVISPAQARRQAAERKERFSDELTLLLIHGLLHLLGYDHERGAGDARIMRRKEREILDAVSKVGR